ncbi:NAD(P)/FAD-dependent oxidoreductase [Dongia soli]|uniref:FAD-binding oxidoreductase n=1 Tax=Dongia soli TaxID=600628 RepID=A0ABU5EEJ3_9PROT|nr:FAD-binding oxidoreductase [Dongia soli]MDY0884347.1 FAD-binding oxidoreductase [Dongia soli]
MGFNNMLNIERSYYVATANRTTDHPRLTDVIDADLVVVGAGCTGLSAALHAAQRGLKVVVLEGGKVGWGASGRNGGQMSPGLRKGALGLVKQYGEERGRLIYKTTFAARQLVLDIIEKHSIQCDLKLTGHVSGIVKKSDIAHYEAEADCLRRVMGMDHLSILSSSETRKLVNTHYEAGTFSTVAGHMHPLNYTLGLAKAAVDAGVTIFENSAAIALERKPRIRVSTASGAVVARHAILAGDALLRGLEPEVNNRIMPVGNYIIATNPLPNAHELIPSDAAISDSRFVVNYYRLSADGRLLFGGGEKYTPRPPRDIAAFVRPYVEQTFPQLRGCKIDYAWGGLVSITTSRLPHIGRRGDVLFAHGYSGLGVLLSTLGGKILAESLVKNTPEFETFAALRPQAFPGRTALRSPLYVLAMLWYAMRDRL